MRIEYKTIPLSELQNLNEYGKDGWITSIVVNNFIVLYREPQKIKKSTSLTVKTCTNTLNFLLSCQQRAENAREWGKNNGISEDTLFEFADHWLEKGENDKKHRFEKEKVFDIRKRLRTWIDKPWNKKTEKISNITF